MIINKRIQITNNPLTKDERKLIEEITYKPISYGKIDFLMSFSGIGDVPKA